MRELVDREMQAMAGRVAAFPFESKKHYGNFLAQTYYFVCHSTRLLARSASRFGVEEEQLHQRFGAHMGEEKSHHLLALHDLRSLGLNLASFPELPITRAFYECQYFKCTERHPASLLGYILLLEGVAVVFGGPAYQRVAASHGKAAGTFLKVHAADDVDHLEAAFAAIGQMPQGVQAEVRDNFVQSTYLYSLILAETAK